MGKTMLQSCTTELSELCERLAREMNLVPKQVDNKVELRGDDFLVYRMHMSDVEFLIYRDKISTAAFDERSSLRYTIKGRYLDGHKQVLERTIVGKRVIEDLDKSCRRHGWTKEQLNHSDLVADVEYGNPEEAYKFIKSNIFD